MSALPRPKSASRPPRPLRRKARKRPAHPKPIFLARAIETTAVLGINITLIGTCLYTVGNMLPHQLTQEAKLQEMKGEIDRTANHIEQLKQSHQQSLTPKVSRQIAEEQGHLIRKNKRNLVWIKPNDDSSR